MDYTNTPLETLIWGREKSKQNYDDIVRLIDDGFTLLMIQEYCRRMAQHDVETIEEYRLIDK